MKFITLKSEDTVTGEVVVNLDLVVRATPDNERKWMTLTGSSGAFLAKVDYKQFTEAISETGQNAEVKHLSATVSKLSRAVERLAAHVPSSVRMHF